MTTFLANLESLENSDWLISVTKQRDATAGSSARHKGPGPHANGSPQSIHGKGDAGGPLSIAKQGGDSVQLTGRRPTSGYMVARPPSFGTIVTASDWFDRGDEILVDFVNQRSAQFKSDPDAFVGVWWDRKHREFALDVSMNVADLDDALSKGRAWDQQAIWDVVNMVEIPTGGTGGRSGQVGRSPATGLGPDDPRAEARMGAGDRRSHEGGLRGRAGVDPEVAEALERFYLRHLAGQHNQKSHAGGRGGTGNAALDSAEANGQRITHPITSADQLDDRQKASLAQAFEPYTRKHKDGTTSEIHIDRGELKSHVKAAIQGATPEQVEAGKRWYGEARDYGDALAAEFGVDREVAFGVIASLSPNTGWEANKTKARNALARHKSGEFDHLDDMAAAKAMRLGFAKGPNSDAVQAVRIMRHPELLQQGLPTGLKRQSFVNNMAHPDNEFDVTVDGWVAGALQRSSHGLSEADALDWINRGTDQALSTGLVVKSKGYIAVADIMREVAAETGMSPQQAQAVYWVAMGGGQAGSKMWDDKS